MKIIIAFVISFVAILLLSCSGEKKTPLLETLPSPIKTQIAEEISRARQNLLMREDAFIFSDDNDNANFNLFGGILCYSGEKWACDSLKKMNSYDFLCRNPWECGKIFLGETIPNEASRDELLGRILFWTATDKSTAKNYIYNNKICKHPTDDRCDIDYTNVGILALLRNFNLWTSDIFGYEAVTLASLQSSELGYRVHLQAITILLYKQNKMCSLFPNCTYLINALINRDPDNEFYQYIGGKRQESARLFLLHTKEMNYKVQSHWYTQNKSSEQKWKTANAACTIALGNLILKE